METHRRAIVLHHKNGRTHSHVVWDRYIHGKGKMKSHDYSYHAHDRAREEMERKFGHKLTPVRNKRRPEMKASLTKLWHQTGTGREFINAAKDNNYLVAQGSDRRAPYMVIDEFGRSYNLVRQLESIKTKEVRERLNGEKLIGEKEAIRIAQHTLKIQNDKQKHKLMKKKKENEKLLVEFSSNKKVATEKEVNKEELREMLRAEIKAIRDQSKQKDKDKGKEYEF